MPSYANLANLALLEELYLKWKKDPESIDFSWISFFEGMELGKSIDCRFLSKKGPSFEEGKIAILIDSYRREGHCLASFNPIVLSSEADISLPKPDFSLAHFGFSQEDLSKEFSSCGFLSKEKALLGELIDSLQKTYCQRIGIEYMHIESAEIKKWIQSQIEPGFPISLSLEERVEIWKKLSAAHQFEMFLHTKYVGQKRFSLEGAETLIPMLHAILERTPSEIKGVVLGMAHRGRLNVLANVLGKSYEYIFEEFEDKTTFDLEESSGDVKYHMGFAAKYPRKSGVELTLILSANPSHLESVDPVVEGEARALQDLLGEGQVLPILIHGDAAVAGQGVVYETMALSQLQGYKTGGTIHLVINNHIGFTTSPKEGRSTRYCTDIGKTFDAPVLHVNSEDPDACVWAARLALDLKNRFGCDVFIDMQCYRKYGHNEGDEPSFTQPIETAQIRQKIPTRESYKERLLSEGAMTQDLAREEEKVFLEQLQTMLEKVKSKPSSTYALMKERKKGDLAEMLRPFPTGVKLEVLQELATSLNKVPAGFHLHPKIDRLLKERSKMVERKDSFVDWAMAELLAYSSLAVQEKIRVRLSGQDVRRGTFSHRHSVYVDQIEGTSYYPLSHLSSTQADIEIVCSPLSEFAVLGFEFGYSLIHPHSLVLWEAQYGDFANSAQVIIDQYLASSEMKWGHRSSLTLLLPHGYAGSGPEHSSARIERYLQLCAEGNLTVVYCSTPAQFFHLLRRQALRPLKKPLILFTPKEILRHPRFKSPAEALVEGQFEEILIEGASLSLAKEDRQIKTIVLCSGKIYYELLEEKEKRGSSLPLITIEQLYPLDREKLDKLLSLYPNATQWIWAQEEPQNMGAWSWIAPQIEELLPEKIGLRYAGRQKSAVTATGSPRLHQLEYMTLMKEVFEGS